MTSFVGIVSHEGSDELIKGLINLARQPRRSLEGYKVVQRAAKLVLGDLCSVIGPDSTEASIEAFSVSRLSELGFPNTWYYNCPALVLAGNRSCLSISGRQYVPAAEPLGENCIVTVDLSPCLGDVWGDCARSFAIEDGQFTVNPVRREFRRGFDTQSQLHADMKGFVAENTRFCDLFEFANDLIASAGYVNLDFLGNVGHSIAKSRKDRVYIDAKNTDELSSVPLFTFEPHIRASSGAWGFKHENIYFFDEDGDLQEL